MRELKKNWLDLFQLFRVSLHMPKLLLSAVGLLLTVGVVGLITVLVGSPDFSQAKETWVQFARNPELLTDYFAAISLHRVYFLFLFPFAITFNLCRQVLSDGSLLQQISFGVLSGVSILVIWSYIGTAISRLAAVEITRDERIEGSEALGFAWDRFLSTVMSFILPLIGFAFFGLVIAFVGLFINIPYFNMLVMLALPLALIGGFVMALIGVGTAGGFPLFVPSIAVEGTDSFDAISRGFSYVLSRVWSYLWYGLVAVVYGLVCSAFVLGFAHLILLLTNGAGVLATKWISFPLNDVISLDITHSWDVTLTGIVYFSWVLLFQFMVIGFLVSYYFSSSTLIYLLMRKRVDGIDMEEVYEELDEDEDLLFEDESFEEEFDDEGETDTESPESDESDDEDEDESDEEEEEEQEQEEFECTESDCDRTFDTEFGRDQHHRLVHQDDDDE